MGFTSNLSNSKAKSNSWVSKRHNRSNNGEPPKLIEVFNLGKYYLYNTKTYHIRIAVNLAWIFPTTCMKEFDNLTIWQFPTTYTKWKTAIIKGGNMSSDSNYWTSHLDWGAFLKHLWWILKISCLKLSPNRNVFWIQWRIWSSSWNLTGGILLDYSIIMPSYFENSNKDFEEEQSASRSVERTSHS